MMMKGFGLDESIISNLTSTLSGETSISSSTRNESSSATTATATTMNQGQPPPPQPPPTKKRRSLPGHPDPDAEVIALSPKSLLATNRFVCEICNKGFQRDQNLQLHRRGHNLPWKLKQRANKDQVRKKVYVCPEPSCVHHDPARALGDLTGIKKHFCRKHGEKKWKCDKCSKKYAVQSDWKAHSKICGTREYRCDCGTLFSRRDSFITHRAFCDALAAAEESGRYSTLSSSIAAINTPTATTSIPSPHLLHSLSSLKRDPPLAHVSFPPWLSSSSSSSLIVQPHHHDHPHHQQQVQQQHHLYASVDHESAGGPTSSSLLPQMSATALLQKAAEMGVTLMSNNNPQEAHVASSSSSRDHHHGQQSSSAASVLHDMMIINSLNNNNQGGLGFGGHQQQLMHHHQQHINHNQGGHQGVMTSAASGRPPVPPFSGGGRGRGSGGDGLSTRDFLGLRTFSHQDFINMAALQGAQTSPNNSAPSIFDHHEQHHHHNHNQQQQQEQLHHDHHQQQLHHHDGHDQNQTPW